MSTIAISDIHEELSLYTHNDAEYWRKMMHPLPKMPVMDRLKFILPYCKGKTILNLGSASGELHGLIKAVASHCVGVDKEDADISMNLDEQPNSQEIYRQWRQHSPKHMDLIVAGEILEHLANPGNLLNALRDFHCELLVTVPNAFTAAAPKHLKRGYENVNIDHVAWYSPRTLRTLLERYKFHITHMCWYNGQPGTAEGLIALAR